jgi:hypothetical protein
MSSSSVEKVPAVANDVEVTDDTLTVELSDGRTIAAPLAWFPRLTHASAEERRQWRLIAGGRGIHWPALDEDISIAGLLAGQPSSESQASLRKWLDARRKTQRAPKRIDRKKSS